MTTARRVYPEFNRRFTLSLTKGGFALPLIIGLILALTALGAITYWQFKPIPQTSNSKPQAQDQIAAQSPTPTPNKTVSTDEGTANWKTYSDTDGNYSFKYPVDWKISNVQQGTKLKGFVSFQNYEIPNTPGVHPGNPKDHVFGSVFVAGGNHFRGEAYRNLSESDFLNPNGSFWIVGKNLGGIPGTDYEIPIAKTVGGKKAMAQIYHPSQTYESVSPNDLHYNYYVYLNQNDILFIGFQYRADYESKDKVLKQFNQILSTFRFI